MKIDNTLSKSMEIVLRIFGIWPNSSYILLSRLFWIIAIIMEQVFEYRWIVTHFYSAESFEVMKNLSETMAYTIFLIKLGTFWVKQRTFIKILTMMATDFENRIIDEVSMITTTYYANLSRRLNNGTIVIYTVAILLNCSNIFANDEKASNTSTKPLILAMDLPFDLNQALVYWLIIIIQFFHLILSTYAHGMLNTLLINLILHAGGQIDILRKWLTEMFPTEEKLSEKSGLNPLMIQKVIKKHQQVITFSEKIEEMYTNIALVLFVSDTLIICCLGYTLVMLIGTPDGIKIIMRIILFYVVSNMEAFTFCFAGEYLTNKTSSIGDAVYNSCWYDANSKDSRFVVFMIMRSQKQLTITIGKVLDLSMERFCSIIKASASYVSVLTAMY
ncbi:Odorant receptor 055 [Nylanderia fulva]|uniref:Odorant receptor n=1 Tax=Nylanderia fulva TaxID=613905 RepID=A0A6G1LQ61_9HYME|nr:Odorant receptor 055 [Nylanderia fulva]